MNKENSYLSTPVLFLVFNRPELAQKVFEQIKVAKPKELFIACDGPRKNNLEDIKKVSKSQEILNQIDWSCKVTTLFRKKNLGCRNAVSSAIDWFFENVEEGIILEDDCLPIMSFFAYCEELLNLYRNNDDVMQINGFNPLIKILLKESYYFSKHGPIWGWATWKKSWEHYDVNISSWPTIRESHQLEKLLKNKAEYQWRVDILDRVFDGSINTWDYQWGLAKLLRRGLSITPKFNQIKNIGFGGAATHTAFKGDFPNYLTYLLKEPFTHPKNILRNKNLDERFFYEFAKPSIIKSILNKIKHFFFRHNDS